MLPIDDLAFSKILAFHSSIFSIFEHRADIPAPSNGKNLGRSSFSPDAYAPSVSPDVRPKSVHYQTEETRAGGECSPRRAPTAWHES